MAAKEGVAPIIIRRARKRPHAAHHGGMWKIAYADFVTAMMAFFLLMWLLTTSAEADLKGIATYFQTPIKLTVSSGKVAGDPATIMNAGGRDLTRPVGHNRTADADLERRERRQLESFKTQLESLVAGQATLKQFKDQILMDITDEGLRIQIVDEKNRPMFDTGKTVLKDYSKIILSELARALNAVPNKLSISGHTDATAYAGGDAGYSNWELSADRANAARRTMLSAGMDPSKALRVVGLSDSVPFTEVDPRAPQNRRISIVVLNKRSEEFLKKGGVTADVPAIPETLEVEGAPWRVSATTDAR
ncbi:flagellar motor protein MotB [Pigmentiphaga litoralis]|uniref:flagellar motor protein MotB n=1 Tax=Pigmentiphaga litoralis TaxID=516702 RepID=UPI003B43295B